MRSGRASGHRQTRVSAAHWLDPDNFRFVDHAEYRSVPPERVFDANMQRRASPPSAELADFDGNTWIEA